MANEIVQTKCNICGLPIRSINKGVLAYLLKKHKDYVHGKPKIVEIDVKKLENARACAK